MDTSNDSNSVFLAFCSLTWGCLKLSSMVVVFVFVLLLPIWIFSSVLRWLLGVMF